MAFIKSIAFTPSVMGFWPMTAPPTQGSLFLCPGRRSVDFCCSGIVTQRAGHAAAPTFMNDASRRPYQAERGFFQKIQRQPMGVGWRLCFSSASRFWEDVAVSRQFSFSVSGDDNGRFLGGRKRSPSETQFILPIAVIHGHARKVPIIRDVAVAHTVSLIDQKDTCN